MSKDDKDDKDGKDGKDRIFHSVPMPGRRPVRPVVPQMPKSLDDTVGQAIFDQERSWLRAERDRTDPAYTVITLGLALPSALGSQMPPQARTWIRDNLTGLQNVTALEALMFVAQAARNYGMLLHGRYDGKLDELFRKRPLTEAIDASVLERFAEGVSIRTEISDRPVIAETIVRFRYISGLGDARPLSVKGQAVLNWIFRILSLMLEVTVEATRADLEN